MSQWGNARSSGKRASNGWSAWGGQTYGVYHALQDPCGSSSGSAVSMALGLAAAAIGAEAVGSITRPAMRSNMVRIKPTSGLVARDNVIVTLLRGTIGPIARTVRDAAIMLSFMARLSQEDSGTDKIPFTTILDYESRARLMAYAIAENPIAKDMNVKAVVEAFEGVITLLRANGVTVIDNASYPEYKEVNTVAPQQFVGTAEYKRDMAAYFSGLEVNPQNIRSIEDMISCTKSHSKEEYPSRDIAYWENVRTAEDFSSAKVVAAANRIKYLGGPGEIDGALDAANADALIFPSIVSSDVAGLASHPIVNIPLGFMPADTPVKKTPRGDLVEEGPNIPYSLSFIGRRFSEQRLIELAFSFEQLTHFAAQRKPMVLPKTDLANTVVRRKRSLLSGA